MQLGGSIPEARDVPPSLIYTVQAGLYSYLSGGRISAPFVDWLLPRP